MRPSLKRSTPIFLKCVSVLTLFLIFASSPCDAVVDLTFQWSPNPDSDEVAGYKIYYKAGLSGPPYNGRGAIEGDSPITIPLREIYHPLYPEYTIRNLDDDQPLRFVITAYDVYGFESEYSNELCYNCDAATYSSSTSTTSSEDDLISGCFIATAAYGSPIEPHVEILKDFRDQFLLPNKYGKKFVALYYQYSPPIAEIIAKHRMLKLTVRLALFPIVGMSWTILKFGTIPVCLFMGFIFLGLLGYARRKAKK